MQGPTFSTHSFSESVIEGKSFPPRVFVITTKTPHPLNCHICNQEQHISKSQTSTECGHLIRCNECTDYQIEKFYRCPQCCKGLLGIFPPPCSSHCSRLQNTLNALCSTCNCTLTKDCTQCKSSLTFRQTREILRYNLHVFVVSPEHLPEEFSRPCSHYAPCKICVTRLCKARKKHAICNECRENDCRNPTRAQTPDLSEEKCIFRMFRIYFSKMSKNPP